MALHQAPSTYAILIHLLRVPVNIRQTDFRFQGSRDCRSIVNIGLLAAHARLPLPLKVVRGFSGPCQIFRLAFRFFAARRIMLVADEGVPLTMAKLEGKFALITGGNSGLGFACAKRFLEEGARVCLWDANAAVLAESKKVLGDVHAIEVRHERSIAGRRQIRNESLKYLRIAGEFRPDMVAGEYLQPHLLSSPVGAIG